MTQIPTSQHTTAQAIIKWYGSKQQEHRPHMGASLIGDECSRKVWLTWRWALKPSFDGRILRLFEYGKKAEDRIFAEMRAAGIEVWDVDNQTGDQWRVSACNGHFGGSLDAVAMGVPEAPKTPCVVEVKTHNDKSFKELTEKGVKAAKPIHWYQFQIYCRLMELDRALYVAENKNTSELYTEWVHAEPQAADEMLAKAERLIAATEPPPRISNDPTNWQCKFCNFHPVCHGDTAAEANCRTCCHATPVENAGWHCDNFLKPLPEAKQRQGCDEHLMIPALVPYAEPQDGGNDYVVYKHKTSGVEFSNGPGPEPRFTSAELHRCPGALIEDVAPMKAAFPTAKVVDPWPDMPSDDLDAVPTKRDLPVVRERKARVTKTLQALQAFKP